MEEWKEYKLGEVSNIQTGPFGSQLHQRDYVDEGTPCIMPTNIGIHLDILSDGIAKVKSEDVNRLKKHCVKVGDIIYSRRGDIEKCAYITQKEEGWLCGTGCLRIRIESEITNPHFIAYQLCTKECKSWIVGNAIGTTMLNLNSGILKELPLLIPNKQQQDKIVSILKSLDDKIEVNRKINENLEQQAQALFKSWFVDFEPFKDGEFVDSELGMIPKGWSVGTLGDICSQSSLKVESRDDVKVLSPVTTGNLMLSEEYFTKQVFSESIAKYKVVNKGAFAYNPARVNIGSLGRNEYDFDGAVSPVYVVFECKEGYSNYFDLFRTTEKFKTEVLLRAIGGVRQSLNYVDFAMIQTIIAPQDVVDAFNPMFERLKSIKKHLEKENNRLATLRDTLLPKLMLGELKVNEVEI